jgi:hypothetical protein
VRAHVQFSPLPQKIKSLNEKESKELIRLISSVFEKGKEENFFDKNTELEMLLYSLIAPLGVIIAQSVLFRNNTKPLKDHLKKYFQFWKSQFFNREK